MRVVLTPKGIRPKLRRRRMSFHGVGSGSVVSKNEFELPISVCGIAGSFTG